MLDWHVREGLLAYVELLKQDAREEYRQAELFFAMGKLKKLPPLPRILRDG